MARCEGHQHCGPVLVSNAGCSTSRRHVLAGTHVELLPIGSESYRVLYHERGRHDERRAARPPRCPLDRLLPCRNHDPPSIWCQSLSLRSRSLVCCPLRLDVTPRVLTRLLSHSTSKLWRLLWLTDDVPSDAPLSRGSEHYIALVGRDELGRRKGAQCTATLHLVRNKGENQQSCEYNAHGYACDDTSISARSGQR